MCDPRNSYEVEVVELQEEDSTDRIDQKLRIAKICRFHLGPSASYKWRILNFLFCSQLLSFLFLFGLGALSFVQFLFFLFSLLSALRLTTHALRYALMLHDHTNLLGSSSPMSFAFYTRSLGRIIFNVNRSQAPSRLLFRAHQPCVQIGCE